MAVIATQLLTSGSAVDGTSYTTASVAPSAHKLILLGVGSDAGAGTADQPTVSGGGVTWTLVNTATTGVRRATIWRALSETTPTPGTITITFANSQLNCNWSITEFLNVDETGTNGANAVVQSAPNTGSGVTSLTVTLGAFGSVDNATFGVIQKNGVEAVSPGSGFTELGESNVETTIEAEFKSTNDTSVDWTWATNHVVCGVAVEIKYALYIPKNGNFLAFM